jgi:hypothetical protein
MYYTLCVCVCSLSYPACKAHAPYYIVFCDFFGCTTSFSHYLTNCPIFGKNFWTLNVCFVFFSLKYFSVWQDLSEMQLYIVLHLQYPLFFSYFKKPWIFSTDFEKKSSNINSMESLLVGAELFHANGRTGYISWYKINLISTTTFWSHDPVNSHMKEIRFSIKKQNYWPVYLHKCVLLFFRLRFVCEILIPGEERKCLVGA